MCKCTYVYTYVHTCTNRYNVCRCTNFAQICTDALNIQHLKII